MLSINTNLSSLITQTSMNSATARLNQAVERMTTGAKINHAKDNAANYSISTNMTTKINSYMVAEDNVAMGLDLVTTATSGIDLIIDKLTRLKDLAIQANNGTYGESSLKAINIEANTLVDEMERIQNTSEYNGKKLLKSDDIFLKKVDKVSTLGMQSLSEVDETVTLAQGEYAITSADDLAKLARMQNAGKITAGSRFIQATDIDLSSFTFGEGWTPIGTTANPFSSEYDGNGYTISNLYISKNSDNLGLFGVGYNSVLKNIGIKNGEINTTTGYYIGGLIARDIGGVANILNCYANVNIKGDTGGYGGLAGTYIGAIDFCYSTANVNGGTTSKAGGLVAIFSGSLTNSYATGEVSINVQPGGLVGYLGANLNNVIENCYSTGNVSGCDMVGGFLGASISNQISIKNCYSTGDVKLLDSTIDECAACGFFGGFYQVSGIIENCYATGDVYSMQDYCTIAGFGTTHHNLTIKNCYTTSSLSVENVTNLTKTDDFVLSLSGANLSGIVDSQAYKSGSVPFTLNFDYDNTKIDFEFQVGINSEDSSRLGVDYSYGLANLESLRDLGIKAGGYIEIADRLIEKLSNNSIKLGAVQNRLESALEEISVQYENLVSSRSTLRDADIAKESSKYIQAQILQQASATLMATANQSPSIALQLI